MTTMATMATPALDTNAISTIASNTTTESGNSTDSVASTSSSSTPEPKPSDIDGVGLGNDDLYWISKVNSLNISNKGMLNTCLLFFFFFFFFFFNVKL